MPSPGVTFTYRENPVLKAFVPLRSFVRWGLSLPSLASATPPPCPSLGPIPHPPIQVLTRCSPLSTGLVRMWWGWSTQQEAASGKPHRSESAPPRNPDGQSHGPSNSASDKRERECSRVTCPERVPSVSPVLQQACVHIDLHGYIPKADGVRDSIVSAFYKPAAWPDLRWGAGGGGTALQAPGLEAAGTSLPRGAHSGTTPTPSGGRSISVTGLGFSLIQRFAMVVIAEPLQTWRRRREAGLLRPLTVSAGAAWAAALLQFLEMCGERWAYAKWP